MSLRFEDLPGLISCRLEPPSATGILGPPAIDSRKLSAGNVFWALKGDTADGHAYVDDAIGRGAQAVVVREDWFQSHRMSAPSTIFIVVEDTLAALQALAQAHRNDHQIPVIGLTGSNGKTATKELLAAALSPQFKVLKSPGNYNNHIGIPLTLLQIMEATQVVIVEMGTNQPGDISLLCSLAKPDCGLVLNVAPSHLRGFGDLEGVSKEKGELLTSLPHSGAAFLNSDDFRVRTMASSCATRICFGFNADTPGADCSRMLCAENLGLSPKGKGRFRLRDVVFNLSWYGNHQVPNALAALSVADHFGVPLKNVAEQFAAMPPIKGRLNVEKFGGIIVIDDTYNANPASTSAALDFLRSLTVSGRKHVVLGDHLELGQSSEAEHRRIGRRLASENLDGIFLIGSEMRFAVEELAGRATSHSEDVDNLDPVLARIVQTVHTGDVLLVKGSRGMRLERIVDGLRRHFAEEVS